MPDLTAQRHGYRLVHEFPSSPGSQFVARVEDDNGQYILKNTRRDHEAFSHEARTLKLWEKTGASAHLIDEPEKGLLVIEFIEGTAISQPAGHARELGEQVGQLAAELHVHAPTGTRTLEEHLQRDWSYLLESNPLIDPDLKKMAYDCMQAMVTADAKQVVLHGDLRPTNIICTPEKNLVAIDPYGIAGPGEFDLGYFVVCTSTDDRRSLMREVAKGYGRPTPLLAEAFAWNCILTLAYYIHKELPFDGLHLDVADLKRLGCPQAFLSS